MTDSDCADQDAPADEADHGQMVHLTIIVDRPDNHELAGQNRGQKYRSLKQHSENIRSELQRLIDDLGLADEVAEISEPTAFNMLFAVATPHAAREIAEFPGVLSVSVAEDVDLFEPPDEPKTR